MSNIGGLLVVLALYYIIEPFGFALLTDHVSTQTAMFGSLRLLALAVMIHYSAKLFIDSIKAGHNCALASRPDHQAAPSHLE